ncbi:MAG TPA: hypothetical protein VGJ73_21260 [Verrucomicrobiae bacterium]|jgi:hypothetical protein
MANEYTILIAFVTAAAKIAGEQQDNQNPNPNKVTPISVLDDIIIGRFKSDIAEGKTLVSSSEAGGSVGFTLVGSLTPADVVAKAVEAKMWINSQADPNNPETWRWPERRMRLRVTFSGREPTAFF